MKLDISTRKGYSIACAMRGPDNEAYPMDYLKELFTAKIRAWAGAKKGDSFGLVRTTPRLSPFLYSWLADEPEILHAMLSDCHYLDHVRCALKELRLKGRDEGERLLLLELS